jgi:hypothetical protein
MQFLHMLGPKGLGQAEMAVSVSDTAGGGAEATGEGAGAGLAGALRKLGRAGFAMVKDITSSGLVPFVFHPSPRPPTNTTAAADYACAACAAATHKFASNCLPSSFVTFVYLRFLRFLRSVLTSVALIPQQFPMIFTVQTTLLPNSALSCTAAGRQRLNPKLNTAKI